MSKLAWLFFLVAMSSNCFAIEVASLDPETKLSQAYTTLYDGHTSKAKLLFNEVIKFARIKGDKTLEARGRIGLGDVYKTIGTSKNKKVFPNYRLSVKKYNEAALLLAEAGSSKRAAMAYLGAALSSSLNNNKAKACDYYNESEKAYQQPSTNQQDIMNPELDSKEKPFSKTLADYKAKDGCR